jgi:hypothetical protein
MTRNPIERSIRDGAYNTRTWTGTAPDSRRFFMPAIGRECGDLRRESARISPSASTLIVSSRHQDRPLAWPYKPT